MKEKNLHAKSKGKERRKKTHSKMIRSSHFPFVVKRTLKGDARKRFFHFIIHFKNLFCTPFQPGLFSMFRNVRK